MGKIIIEIPEEINMTIKAKNIEEAVKKIKQNKKLKNLQKFKGIGKKDYKLEEHKEDWYNQ
jgi:hypothetical protein